MRLIYTLTVFILLITAAGKAQSCGNDTLLYTRAKATANATYTLSAASNFLAYGQYYTAPQGITVKGLCFYGHVPGNGQQTVTVTGHLYDMNPLDSLPFDPPMASGTVAISNNDPNAPLADQRHIITFDTPITMYGAFVMVIETPGAPAIKIYGNASGDGDLENLSITRYNFPWVKMLSFASDNDFYIEPIVEYTLNPSLSFVHDTVCAPGTLYVSGAAPGIGFDKMYCKAAFNGNPLGNFQFNIGTDVLSETLDTFYNVSTTGPVVVNFTEAIAGWTMQCTKTVSDTVYFIAEPVANYTSVGFGLTVDFYATTPYATEYTWDFGDGTVITTTEDSVQHTFANPTNYTICLVASNQCGRDTVCSQFLLPYVGVEEELATQFAVYPNPAKGEVYINASTALQGNLSFQIFDLGGRQLSNQSTNGMALPARFDISNLSPGIYLTRLQSGSASVTKKLVVVE